MAEETDESKTNEILDDEEEEEQKTEQIEEEPNEKLLDENIMQNCMSVLCKTADGINYAYVQLYCTNKAITDISLLSRYLHLRIMDLSHNFIEDISPLAQLSDLLTLDCSFNRITALPQFSLPYLRHMNLSNNRLETLNSIAFDELEVLNLNGNKLRSLYNEANEPILCSHQLPNLRTIELRGNKLTTTAGLEMLTDIETVYLGKNEIVEICELDNLSRLMRLHLRENNLENLDGIGRELQSLQYLNLRDNKVPNMEEVQKLKHLSLLRALVLAGNPVADLDEYRLETLIAVRKLIRLDKDSFLDEERSEAEKIYEQRINEEMLNSQNISNDEESRKEE